MKIMMGLALTAFVLSPLSYANEHEEHQRGGRIFVGGGQVKGGQVKGGQVKGGQLLKGGQVKGGQILKGGQVKGGQVKVF